MCFHSGARTLTSLQPSEEASLCDSRKRLPPIVFMFFSSLNKTIAAVTNARVTSELFNDDYEVKGSGLPAETRMAVLTQPTSRVLGCALASKPSGMIHSHQPDVKVSYLFCQDAKPGRISLVYEWSLPPHFYRVNHGFFWSWTFSHCHVNQSPSSSYFPDVVALTTSDWQQQPVSRVHRDTIVFGFPPFRKKKIIADFQFIKLCQFHVEKQSGFLSDCLVPNDTHTTVCVCVLYGARGDRVSKSGSKEKQLAEPTHHHLWSSLIDICLVHTQTEMSTWQLVVGKVKKIYIFWASGSWVQSLPGTLTVM